MNGHALCCTLVLTVTLTSACGGGSEGDVENDLQSPEVGQAVLGGSQVSIQTVTEEMLQGQWLAGCRVDDDGLGVGTATDYSGSEFTIWSGVFDNANCSYAMFELTMQGNYTLGEESIATNGTVITDLNRIGRAIYLKPSDADLTEYMNESATCNDSNWRVGEYKNVTECADFSPALNNYDIVQFDEDIHFLGDKTDIRDGSSASKRPVNINYAVTYSRIYNDETPLEANNSTGISRGTPRSTLESLLSKLRVYGLRVESM